MKTGRHLQRLAALEVAATGQDRRPALLSAAELAELDRLPIQDGWRRFAELLAARLPAETFDHLALVYGGEGGYLC